MDSIGQVSFSDARIYPYIQLMSARNHTVHHPANAAEVQLSRYGSLTFQNVHADGYGAHIVEVKECTESNFEGREDIFRNASKYTKNSLLCPETTDRMELQNSRANGKDNKQVILTFT